MIDSVQQEQCGLDLLNRYTGQNLYRGFESLPLRQSFNFCYLQYVTTN
jgi:hypothetical protein